MLWQKIPINSISKKGKKFIEKNKKNKKNFFFLKGGVSTPLIYFEAMQY